MNAKFSGVLFVRKALQRPFGAFLRSLRDSQQSTPDQVGQRRTRVCAARIRSMSKVRVRANSTAAARYSLLSSVEEQKQATFGRLDELTPDSSFLTLAREFLDHVEFTGISKTRPAMKTAGSSRRR
jgi:hypothetical protein